jgi:hypothetical protein
LTEETDTMRRLITVALSMLLLAGLTGAGNAGPTVGGIASDHIEYVTSIPFEQSTSTGARVVGKYLYTTSWKNMSIYDVSDPASPQLLSTTPFAVDAPSGGQPARVENEDVATNGKILVFTAGFTGAGDDDVYIYNVEDKTNPTLLSLSHGFSQHTMSCVLDCKWLYGSEGVIVDIRDPSAPKVQETRWDDGATVNGHHDVTEVAPGLVLTATDPMLFLDARKDPAHPKLIAMSQAMGEFIHSTQWPNNAKDKFAMSTGETWVPGVDTTCKEDSAGLSTWDASKWKKTHTLTKVDTFRPKSGTFTDGNPAVNAPFGCSSHWFQQHPKFHNGGLVAAGFYNHGTRIFRVASNGKITEPDWFIPYAGGTSAAYWVGDRYIYSVDYERGIYVLKYTGKI